MRVELEAFAKVNLSLRVLGKRPDGFHELDTVFQTVGLADRLVLETADELSFSVDDPTIPAGEENLVLKAARALQRESRVRTGARMRLTKAIPAGGGLGGGSSDAAAALLGLRALWDLPISGDRLAQLAADLGSDVPFFLVGGTARGRGRGEKIEPLPDLVGWSFVLCLPPFSLSTAEVYGRLSAPRLTGEVGDSNLGGPGADEPPDRNDLESPAEKVRPELARLRDSLLQTGALRARLSGSGSTVFGVFPGPVAAREGAARLEGLPIGTAVRVVPAIGRGEFLRRAVPAKVLSGKD